MSCSPAVEMTSVPGTRTEAATPAHDTHQRPTHATRGTRRGWTDAAVFSYRLPDKVPPPRWLTLTQTCRPHQPATELEGRLLTLQKKGEEMHSLGGTIQSPCAARCLSKKDEKWPAAPLTVQNSPRESNMSTQRHFQRHKNQRFLYAGPTEQL